MNGRMAGVAVGRHPPILTSEQRAGDLTRRWASWSPFILCTIAQRIAGPNKGPSCQHAYMYTVQYTKITGVVEILLDSSSSPEVGILKCTKLLGGAT